MSMYQTARPVMHRSRPESRQVLRDLKNSGSSCTIRDAPIPTIRRFKLADSAEAARSPQTQKTRDLLASE